MGMSEFARLTRISFALWQLFCLGHALGQTFQCLRNCFQRNLFCHGRSDLPVLY